MKYQTLSFLTLTLSLTLQIAAAPANPRPTLLSRSSSGKQKRNTPITDGSQVNGQTFDYVIAGGGLTGVVLATRLSQDAGRKVLLIESGYDQESNPGVYEASQYQSTFGSSIDWAYQTTPQTSANSQPQTIRAGKALGGSTTINGMAWSKPHDFQIDALETVGNPGVNWASLQNYMFKAESFTPPSSSQYSDGVTYTPSCHTTGGPISIEYDPSAMPSTFEHTFNTTLQKFGLPYATDLTCGDPAGGSPIANTRSGGTRVDAYRGYLWQKNVPNLTILSGANVGKVLISTSTSTPRATGVQFQDQNSNTYTVTASLEVIMATGSIKTPSILQQSGIGPTSVLQNAGVTQILNLPIGQNLIDQTTCTTDFNLHLNVGGGQPITFPRFQDLFTGSDADTMRGMLQNDLSSWAQDAVNNGAAENATALEVVLAIQRDWILNQNVGFSESFDYAFSSTLGYDSWYLLPFGRGSVQIQDSNPYGGSVSIDPRYFSNPFDRLAQGGTVRYTRTLSNTAPLSVPGEQTPGTNNVGSGASLDQWSTWAQNNYRSNWHPIGTVPMMSRDLGGCVDSSNRVYGITGLRVVDASTLPFQVSSHLMSVLYGLSERAAELIRNDHPVGPPTTTTTTTTTSTTTSKTTSTPPPIQTGVAIHPNGDTTKCLDVIGANFNDGTQVDIYDCNETNAQKWLISRGTGSIKVASTNFCLDAGDSPGDGTQMKIWQCYDNLAAQTWSYNSDNTIHLQSQNLCLDLTDGSKANGNVVQVWQCAGNSNQVWTT